MQRALLQFFAPENYFTVREALEQADRADLIGDGPRCLIPARRRKRSALRRRSADDEVGAGHAGYRHEGFSAGRTACCQPDS